MHPHHLTSATRNGRGLLKTAFSLSNFTRITLSFLFTFFITHLYCQAPAIQWQKALGGTQNDGASSIQQTLDGASLIQQTIDGGYIVAAITGSNDGDVSGNHGNIDSWIVKLHPTGNMQWQRCLGGSGFDGAVSIQQTTD